MKRMPVVSNTSPISNLAFIERLDLLREQFGKILIPAAVGRELKALSNPRAKTAVEAALSQGWLEVRAAESIPLIQLLEANLHVGESEAIALAVEVGASWTLLDEREARAAAQRMNLKITGVLGILLRAKQQGQIASLRPEMERLRKEAHFFISPDLERRILQLAGE
jgi:predicted nucleic acid-binding protein